MKRWILPTLFSLLGCASEPYRWAESDLDSRAPGAAFAGAGMFTRKPMPDRRGARPWQFYYKHCALGAADRPWASKTSYECNGPF